MEGLKWNLSDSNGILDDFYCKLTSFLLLAIIIPSDEQRKELFYDSTDHN
jgi:hypothetical protein